MPKNPLFSERRALADSSEEDSLVVSSGGTGLMYLYGPARLAAHLGLYKFATSIPVVTESFPGQRGAEDFQIASRFVGDRLLDNQLRSDPKALEPLYYRPHQGSEYGAGYPKRAGCQ